MATEHSNPTWFPKRRVALGLGVILILHAGLYLRAAGHGFVWDDIGHITNNPLMRRPVIEGLRAIQIAHSDPEQLSAKTFDIGYDSYRPLQFLSHRLDVELFGMSARAMHLHNLLLSALGVLLVFWIIARIGRCDGTALGAAALFGLHPVQVETTCYISARGDILAAVLALASLALILRARPDPAGAAPPRVARALLLLASCLAYMASLLTKEANLALPLVVVLIAAASGQGRWRLPVIGLAITATVYLSLRMMVVGQDQGMVDNGRILAAIWRIPGLAAQYLGVLALPMNISTERPYRPDLEWFGWGGLIVTLAIAGYLLWRLRGEGRQRVLLFGAGVGWFLMLLAPATIVVGDTRVAADRYVLLPLIGVGLCAGILLRRLFSAFPGTRWPLAAVGAAWGILVAAVTFMQVPVWRSNATLYAHAVAMEPSSSMAQYRLGYLYARGRRWDIAARRFALAVKLDGKNIKARNNLGVAYLNLGRLDDARRTLRGSLRLTAANNYRAWFNLGLIHRASGEPRLSCEAVARAMKINPGYSVARRHWKQHCGER